MAENTIILRSDSVLESFAEVEHNEVTHALNEVSLSVKNDEFISLVGPSGYEKSTTLRPVAGLIPSTTGHLIINRAQITEPSPERRTMFQKLTLFPRLAVKKNISFSLELQGRLKGNEEKVEKMSEIIDFESFRNNYLGQLSGGMAQHVSLVRSLTNEPNTLLLDEPLGALDTFACIDMQDEILKVWREKKQLAITATHDVDEAIYMRTRVIIMDAYPGRVIPDIRIDQAYPGERSSQTLVACRNEILNRLHFGGRSSGQW